MAENSTVEKSSSRLREIVRKSTVLWRSAGVIFLAALVIVILWKVPQWQVAHYQGLSSKDWLDEVNEARKTIATILGGLVLLAGGFATWRNLKLAQESLRVSQEGQITDRFTKAIEQLGAVKDKGEKKLEVRLGGIYALERIANDSERDHWPIMEVLCTYVRENARAPSRGENPPSEVQKPTNPTKDDEPSTPVRPLAADVQAILTVLGRRNRKYERKDQTLDLQHVDIRRADLAEANLSGAFVNRANLHKANLYKANLSGAFLRANLTKAQLIEANLCKADLQGADLSSAILSGANLSGAVLYTADLSGARLPMANLAGARLSGANLSGADLRTTIGLTQEQLESAIGDSTTQLPENLHMPDGWGKR